LSFNISDIGDDLAAAILASREEQSSSTGVKNTSKTLGQHLAGQQYGALQRAKEQEGNPSRPSTDS
jgi:hypothetical protein